MTSLEIAVEAFKEIRAEVENPMRNYEESCVEIEIMANSVLAEIKRRTALGIEK